MSWAIIPIFTVLGPVAIGQTGASPIDGVVRLQELEGNRGMLLAGGEVWVLDFGDGTLRGVCKARRASTDSSGSYILSAVQVGDRARLSVWDVKSEDFKMLFKWDIPDTVADVNWCNAPPYSFCVVGYARCSQDLMRRAAARFALVWPGKRDWLLDPVPVLSGISGAMIRAPVFCRSRSYTFAAVAILSAAAKHVIPKDAFVGAETLWGHLVVIVDGRETRAYAVTGTAGSYPLRFSDDGKQLFAKMRLPPVLKRDRGAKYGVRELSQPQYYIIGVDSGTTTPCAYIPAEADVLAVSPDLRRSIIRMRDRIELVQQDSIRRPVCEVAEDRSVVAVFSEGGYIVTDGENLWCETERGAPVKRRLSVVRRLATRSK